MRFFAWIMICLLFGVSAIAQIPGDDLDNPPQPTEKKVEPAPMPGDKAPLPPIDKPKDMSPEAKISDVESQLPPALDEKKSAEIKKYLDEALKNYEDILSQENESEVKTTEKRIKANEGLLEKHSKHLEQHDQKLRKIKLEYVRRYMALKKAFEEKRIDQVTYDKKLDELARRFQFEVNSLSSGRDFYKTEVAKTTKRIKELKESNRINRIFLTEEQKRRGIKKPQKKRPATKLEKFVMGIDKLGCFQVKNFCASSEFK